MRLLHLALSFLLLLPAAHAQDRKTFDLRAEFGLTEMQSMLQLSNLGSLDAMKAKYPRAYARMTSPAPGPAWSDAKFMTLSAFDAAWLQAVWAGLGGGQPISGWLSSNNDVVIPAGTYYQTITAEYSGGYYRGAGAGYSVENNTSQNTRLVIWHERWNGDPMERHGMQAGPWGGKGNITYVEVTRIEALSLDGRSKEFPNQRFNSSGVRMWKPGEVTTTENVFARNFRTAGIEMHGPTPHHIGNLSVFENVVAGLLCVGCWGGTINVDMISGDDNGALIASLPGYGHEAGGTWNVGAVKLETMVATEPNGAGGFERTWRGQPVGVFYGQFAVHIGAISGASGGGLLPSLFVVDPRLQAGQLQGSHLNVGTLKGFNYQYLVHDLMRGRGFAKLGDYRAHSLEYDGAEGLAWQTGSRPLPAVNSLATFRVAHTAGSTTPINMGPTATPHKNIIVGPPKSTTMVYLGEETGTTPPPVTCTYTYSAWSTCTSGRQTRTATASPTGCTGTAPADSLSRSCTTTPTPCTYTYSAWSACTNGTRTRTVTSTSPAGCTGTPGPLQEACTTTPPPTGSTLDPAQWTVVVNTADPTSEGIAAAWCAAWGVPTGNIVRVNAGTNPVGSASQGSAIRTAVEGPKRQYTLLAMQYPVYIGQQSITSYVMFGSRTVSNLTESPVYQYTGTTPRTSKGVAPCFFLPSANYVRRDAHATKPAGQSILVLAKDQTGTPRGSARAGQTATGVTVWDNRSLSNVGNGSNACNWISNDCWVASRKPGTVPIIAAYQSMFQLGADGGAVWAKGFYGDHVTSFGGVLPALSTGLNSQSQTPLTYHLDRGASLSVGSVSEPWQSKSGYSSGSLVEQFVDVRIFHPLFVGGTPVGIAAYAAVRCPDRMLFAGDPMCAPFAR